MKDDLLNFFEILLIASFVLKTIFWLLITDVEKRTRFAQSFVRLYSMYQMHDAPSKKTQTFWRMSNILNLIFWLSIICIALLLVNQLYKATY